MSDASEHTAHVSPELATMAKEQRYQRILEDALKLADQVVGTDFANNWELINNKYYRDVLTQSQDMTITGFSPPLLMAHLGHQKNKLVNMLTQVKDVESFMDACTDYINSEAVELMMVHNDTLRALMGRAYFEQFLRAALTELEECKLFTTEDVAQAMPLFDYYEMVRETYGHLREIVEISSDGETRSLVASALGSAADRAGDEAQREVIIDLLRDSEASLKPDKANDIAVHAMRVYQDLLSSEFHLTQGNDENAGFMTLWLAQQCKDVADLEIRRDEGFAPHTRRQHLRLSERLYQRMGELLHEAVGMLDEPTVGSIVALRDHFDRLKIKAAGMPENYADLLDQALDVAGQDALKIAGPLRERELMRRGEEPQSHASKHFGPSFWPWEKYSVSEYLRHLKASYFPICHRQMNDGRCLYEFVEDAEILADQTALDVHCGSEVPESLLVLKQYLHTARVALGESLMEAGNFDLNALAAAARVEQKCQYYYDGCAIVRQWQREETRHAYDHVYHEAMMDFARYTGCPPVTASIEEISKGMRGRANGLLAKLMKNRLFDHRDVIHPAVPAIYLACRKIAVALAGELPDSKLNTHEAIEFLENIELNTINLLHQTLDSMPQHDPYSGLKYQRQPFPADALSAVMKRLDQQLAVIKHQGIAH
jgi:hypothetical protein